MTTSGIADRLPAPLALRVLDEFSEWKSIYIDYSGKLQRAQIDTGE